MILNAIQLSSRLNASGMGGANHILNSIKYRTVDHFWFTHTCGPTCKSFLNQLGLARNTGKASWNCKDLAFEVQGHARRLHAMESGRAAEAVAVGAVIMREPEKDGHAIATALCSDGWAFYDPSLWAEVHPSLEDLMLCVTILF